MPAKKSSKKSAPKKQSLTKQIKAVVKRQAETKNHISFNTEFAYNTLTSPTGFFPLDVIPQGTASHQRDGNFINPVYLDVRGQVQATNQEAVWYKIFVFEKNVQSNPTQDFMETNAGNFAPAAQDLQAIYARINTAKYKVLATRMLKTGTMSNTANDANAAQLFHMKIPLKGRMEFDDNSNAPQKRQLCLMVIGRRANNDDLNGLTFEFSYNSKLYFKDM